MTRLATIGILLMAVWMCSCRVSYRGEEPQPTTPEGLLRTDSVLRLSQAEWKGTVDQLLQVEWWNYSEWELDEWHIPTREEAQILRAKSTLDPSVRYLCTHEGEFYTFSTQTGSIISHAGQKQTYVLRLVTRIPKAVDMAVDGFGL